MKEIKTKETKKDVRAQNKADVLAKSVERTALRTRRRAGDLIENRQDSPNEYASDRMQVGARNAAYDAGHRVSKTTGEIKGKGKQKVRNRRTARSSAEHVTGEARLDRRKVKRKKRLAERTREKKIKTAAEMPEVGRSQTSVARERAKINSLEHYIGRRELRKSAKGRPAGKDAIKGYDAVKKRNAVRNRGSSVGESTAVRRRNTSIKTTEPSEKGIKQSPRSTGKVLPKTFRNSVKTGQKTTKSAEATSRVAVKTSQEVAKAAAKTTVTAARTSGRMTRIMRGAAIAAYRSVAVLGNALAAILKAIAAGIKTLITAMAAGGSVAMMPILIICMIGLIVASVFGIFFSSEDTKSEKTMQQVVHEINDEYLEELQDEKESVSYDILEMSGSAAVWREVLSIYAVKVNTDPENPQEVASLDDSKISTLKDIFWDMNDISSRSETKTETVIVETGDGNGNIVEERHEETKTTLYITVSHKTAEEMADQYGFSEEQKQQLTELLSEDNRTLWSAVLYGIRAGGDGEIVEVAQSQLGNEGGQKYWSWYGFGSRVSWCACFVSWCANECGYIEGGIIPRFSLCANAVEWFRDRDQWLDGSQEPLPGMIIFFDWDHHTHTGPQDGHADHTGIVEKVEDGKVYTIEGNSKDCVRERQYNVGHYEILGYGVPAY